MDCCCIPVVDTVLILFLFYFILKKVVDASLTSLYQDDYVPVPVSVSVSVGWMVRNDHGLGGKFVSLVLLYGSFSH